MTGGPPQALNRPLRIVCIVPFLNEEQYLAPFLASMASQRRWPDELLLVDDGSLDGSPWLASDFAARHPEVRLLRRPRRNGNRDRLAEASELAAFHWALEHVSVPWDLVAKLDADLVLNPETFATLERAFAMQPDLGIAGAYLSVYDSKSGQLRRERCPVQHARGATKFYRRTCYEQIAPVPAVLGWDTIDELAARAHGWRTGSVACPGGDSVHLRPTGAHGGMIRAQFRWGACAYGIGQHPVWVAASALRRVRDRPYLLASWAFIAGWVHAAVRRRPRASPELQAFGRREQLRTLRALASRPLRPADTLR